MLLRPWVSTHAARIASTAVLAVAAAGVAVGAVVSPGATAAKVTVNDASVWVTNASQLLVGRVNRPIEELDAGVRTTEQSFDVLQHAGTVLVETHGPRDDTLQRLDTATVTLGGSLLAPAGSQASLGRRRVAVVDPATGDLWVRAADAGPGRLTPSTAAAHLGAGAQVVVGDDDVVHAWSPKHDSLLTLPVGTDRATGRGASTHELAAGFGASDVTLSTVGSHAVLFDAADGELAVDGARMPVRGARLGSGTRLQQPGPASDTVLLQTPTDLVSVPLDGGRATVTASGASGPAAAPVFVDGCAYAAWGGSQARFRQQCRGGVHVATALPASAATGRLRFRVNRSVVVLNDDLAGTTWDLRRHVATVDDWSAVAPSDQGPATQDGTADSSVTTPAPGPRTGDDHPPTAVAQSYGVRAGRSTVLPVLTGDTDPDGDVLTASVASGDASALGASLTPVLQSTALQIAVPAGATGSAGFQYAADDGRGGRTSAPVTVAVHPDDVNAAPQQVSVPTVSVPRGGSAGASVLSSWLDPDGDDVVLTGAGVGGGAAGDTVTSTPDGRVTVTDTGSGATDFTVNLQVSDGRAPATGTLDVHVVPAAASVPSATADHALGVAGEPVVITPLANDTDPGGQTLRLVSVTTSDALTAAADLTAGTVTLTAAAPGTTYATYEVTDGAGTATGVIRMDAVAPGGADRPPVAVPDRAVLPAGGQVVTDPTLDDTDPDGDVLSVAGVATTSPGVQADVLDGHLVRLRAPAGLTGPAQVTYQVSDGTLSAQGVITVLPSPGASSGAPPQARPDTLVVRAGDVGALDVLANDTAADGGALTLDPDLAQTPTSGTAFVGGGLLHVAAPDQAGTYTAAYTVHDSIGQSSVGQVTVTVTASDAENQPPQPRAVTAWAAPGATVRIDIPTAGVDPDGDSVAVTGLGSAPRLGHIVDQGATWLDYQAYPDARGTDAFTYVLTDRGGAQATGSIRVAVAAAGANRPPVAVDDAITVRPGRTASVPVLANDSDPDGDAIHVDAASLRSSPAASLHGSTVVVRTSTMPRTTTVPYTVDDGRGAAAGAALTVTTRADAPLVPPVATDVHVALSDLAKDGGADVDVLAADVDPDGDTAALTLSLPPGQPASASVRGRTLHVVAGTRPQAVVYAVADTDGLSSRAVVWVPAIPGSAPAPRPGAPVTRVEAGHSVDIPLADRIAVAPSRTATVSDATSLHAAHGSVTLVDAHTLRFTAAAGYAGPASVTLAVTDGSSAGSATATLSLPITVLAGANVPPTFAGGSLTVVAGGPASTLDLRPAITDPNPGDAARATLTLTGAVPGGIHAGLTGSVLTVSATSDADPGTQTVTVKVSDGHGGTASGPVDLRVQPGTDRPLPRPVDDAATGPAGRATSVDVLANDVSGTTGARLSLVGASVSSGPGSVKVSGGRVIVTPSAGSQGTITVTYQVTDSPGNAARSVQGRLLFTVLSPPGRPSTPAVVAVHATSVDLSWQVPTTGGSDIQHYLVAATGIAQQCPKASCTITGLVPGGTYTFTVTAVNALGASAASLPSEQTQIGGRPDAPGTPALTPADGALAVTWSAPAPNGATITGYDVSISPAAGSGTATSRGTTYQWTGLTNGTAYEVKVRARTSSGATSAWSPLSAPVAPVGAPTALGAPTVAASTAGKATVSWKPPSAGGGGVDHYDVEVTKDGSTTTTSVSGATTQQTLQAAAGATVRVRAVTAAGPGPWSSASAPAPAPVQGNQTPQQAVTSPAPAVQQAAQPATPPVSPPAVVQQPQTAPNAPNAPNAPQGGTGAQPDPNNANGEPSQLTPAPEPGTPTNAPPSTTPDGPPGTPGGVRATPGDRSIAVTVTAPSTGATPTSYQVRANGGASQTLSGPSGSVSGLTNGTSYTVQARACAASGCGDWSSASAAVIPFGKPPAPVVKYTISGDTGTWTWSATSTNGRPITSVIVDRAPGNRGAGVTGGVTGTDTVVASSPCVRSTGDGFTAVDSTGQKSERVYVEATKPADCPSSTANESVSADAMSRASGAATYYVVTLKGFPASSNVTLKCYENGALYATTTLTTDASGSYRSGVGECGRTPGGTGYVTAQDSSGGPVVTSSTFSTPVYITPTPTVSDAPSSSAAAP